LIDKRNQTSSVYEQLMNTRSTAQKYEAKTRWLLCFNFALSKHF